MCNPETDLHFWAIILWGLSKNTSFVLQRNFSIIFQKERWASHLNKAKREGEGERQSWQSMHLNWLPLVILYNPKILKSASEKGEMERAVENGSVTISFQGKWGSKKRVLPAEKQCSLSSVTSDAAPPTTVESLREAEVTRMHRNNFTCFKSLFSVEAIYILSLSCRF